MTPDPLGAAKAITSATSMVYGSLESATKPSGPVSRLLGLDLIHADFSTLRKELDRFVTVVETHHGKHEQTNQAIGMLMSEFKHLQERLVERLETAAKLAEVRADSQEKALRDFEARLQLLGDLVRDSLKGK